MPDVTSGQAAMSAPDPVAMISALLDAEKVTPDTKPQPDQQQAAPEPEAQPETDAYVPENNSVPEGADAEDDRPPVAEIPLDQLEAIELETTYKAEDGKDITEKLPIKALREGFMRQKDYQRKTAELARQREAVPDQVRQGVEGERTQYLNQLKQLETALIETAAPELKNVNWNDLAENNTFEYVRLSNRANQIKQALEAIKTRQQEVTSKMETERRQVAAATAQKTWATLESEIPGWNTETYQAALKATESVGYTATEAGNWLDPRAIKLAHKAYLYDQMQVAKPAIQKKVAAAPAVAIKPGSAPAVNRQVQQKNRALEQLRKSGKRDDFAAVIAAIDKGK